MAKYYVACGTNGKCKASTEPVWGKHYWRKVVNADTSRQAIAKAKKSLQKSDYIDPKHWS